MDTSTTLRRRMLALLVLDLGYRRRPRYGIDPLRHQCAWESAVQCMPKRQVRRKVRKLVAAQRREKAWMLSQRREKLSSRRSMDSVFVEKFTEQLLRAQDRAAMEAVASAEGGAVVATVNASDLDEALRASAAVAKEDKDSADSDRMVALQPLAAGPLRGRATYIGILDDANFRPNPPTP